MRTPGGAYHGVEEEEDGIGNARGDTRRAVPTGLAQRRALAG